LAIRGDEGPTICVRRIDDLDILWWSPYAIDLTGGVMQFDLPTEGFKYYLSQITPHAHAINGYIELIINGADLGGLLPNIAALLGFAVVFLAIALWRFKFD
jgi:ABC-type multidrug transport system permease subunit